ncbi:MAG: short-chain dehydrogenase/reductase [Pseudomonadota bacterium]
MDLGLIGRRALITGASKGIGAATAKSLAAEGCKVHLVSRTARDLEQLVSEISDSFGVEAGYTAADLSQSEQVTALCAAHDSIDILVNNAGAIPAGSIGAVDEAAWREAWDLKVFGYINMCRLMYQNMRARGGVIINIIGVGGERPTPAYAAGAGGNAALMALTRALGGASVRDGVRVVGINPGAIKTDRLINMHKTMAAEKFGNAERWEELFDPEFPPGEPAHIADMVAFLASDRSSNTTGTIITIDGGYCAR